MSDTFSFVHEAEALENVRMLKDTVLLMAQQTAECAYFIRDYAKDSSFCEVARSKTVVILTSFGRGSEANVKEYFNIRCRLANRNV